MATIIAPWGPAAQRIQQFLRGAPMGAQQVASDLAVVKASEALTADIFWRRDIAAAEQKLRERRMATVVSVRRHHSPEESRARRERHERNAAARAEVNRQMARLGGAAKKQKK